MTELGVGLVGLLGAATLLLLVTRELALANGLHGRRQWLLGVGLGAGVLAFGLKWLLIATTVVTPLALPHHRLDAPPDARYPSVPPAPAQDVGRYVWRALPLSTGSPEAPPADPALIALGRRLFADPNLSLDGRVACASCHDLEQAAGADGRRLATGIGGQVGSRNTPTVWNAAFQSRLFWDGRAATLEEQAIGPLLNPIEMGMPSTDAVVDRIDRDASYRPAFEAAFGNDVRVRIDHVATAIAAFERTLITPDTAYDRFIRGDASALSSRQRRGMALFETLGCIACHAGPNFSASSRFDDRAPYRAFPVYRAPGVDHRALTRDTGRAPPGSPQGVWRVPSLRNVALTAPYFHDGSVDDLRDAVQVMATAQLGLAVVDSHADAPPVHRMSADDSARLLGRTTVTPDEIDAVADFLRALSSDSLTARLARGTRQPPDRSRH